MTSQALETDPAKLFADLVTECEEQDQHALLATAKEYLLHSIRRIKHKRIKEAQNHEQDT